MPVRHSRRGRRRPWAAWVALALVALAATAVWLASRGEYEVAPLTESSGDAAPAWTATCRDAEADYAHEPLCARVRGRVVWRQLSDPDGDGDRHLVLVARMRPRIVKLMPGSGDAVPRVGEVVEATGLMVVGSSGHREIYAESLSH